MIENWNNEQGREYLNTPPTDSPEQWCNDILTALKRKWIDGFDAELPLLRYNSTNPAYNEIVGKCHTAVRLEFDRQQRFAAAQQIELNKAIPYK